MDIFPFFSHCPSITNTAWYLQIFASTQQLYNHPALGGERGKTFPNFSNRCVNPVLARYANIRQLTTTSLQLLLWCLFRHGISWWDNVFLERIQLSLVLIWLGKSIITTINRTYELLFANRSWACKIIASYYNFVSSSCKRKVVLMYKLCYH